ncbi:MAG: sterol desaturase family protein [Deltaproteobacteria bacterium]|nr:MAG: sterol desaturase family protein [Deltaproteobacteria bacterium]
MENDIGLRLGFFFGVLATVVLWEHARPKRSLHIKRRIRWFSNLSLVGISSITVRLILPFTAAGVALYAEQHRIGLLHLLSVPFIVNVILSVLLLDLLIYAQHVTFHYLPLFWRLHKVHHIDQDIDVTTGVRFHPLEIILSTLIKCAVVILLGMPVIAVVIFEILLNASSMFNHGNISLSEKLDRWLRLIVVTPDMHRVHHSIIKEENNSNFGFNLPVWDRVFGTYKAQPEKGHLQMEIGLKEYGDVSRTALMELLLIPFRKNVKRIIL